jgi:predicted nuclease of predicted toxin-antitoxin system
MRLLADENFHGKLLKGLTKALPHLDVVRVQDTALFQASDPELLAWAAEEGRILLTHDVQTITRYAYERVMAGLPMAGVIEVRLSDGLGVLLDDLILLLEASTHEEFIGQVRYIPLR